MHSIGAAVDDADFSIAADFGRFGELDARMYEPLGFSAEEIIGTFHNGNSVAELADQFSRPDACLYLATWSAEPAGTVAFNVFSDSEYELQVLRPR
jgi:hypothetical protein